MKNSAKRTKKNNLPSILALLFTVLTGIIVSVIGRKYNLSIGTELLVIVASIVVFGIPFAILDHHLNKNIKEFDPNDESEE